MGTRPRLPAPPLTSASSWCGGAASVLLFCCPGGQGRFSGTPKRVGDNRGGAQHRGAPALRLRMLPRCCPAASWHQGQILPLPSPEAPAWRWGRAAGRGSWSAPQGLAGVPLWQHRLRGTGAALLGVQRGKARRWQLFEGSFYRAWKEPTSAVFGSSSGGAARRFVGGIKSLAPKLLKQGWRVLCLQGPAWVLACIWLMHANSRSPCQQTQQSGRLECES